MHVVLPGKSWIKKKESPIFVENCFALKAVKVNQFCQGTGKFENLEREGCTYEKYCTQAVQSGPSSSVMVCIYSCSQVLNTASPSKGEGLF